jgi:hypothetical protein
MGENARNCRLAASDLAVACIKGPLCRRRLSDLTPALYMQAQVPPQPGDRREDFREHRRAAATSIIRNQCLAPKDTAGLLSPSVPCAKLSRGGLAVAAPAQGFPEGKRPKWHTKGSMKRFDS